MDLDLHDKNVFITGAAGGIGRALVEEFMAEGARVAAHAFHQFESLQPWIDERGWKGRAVAVRADIRNPIEVQAAVDGAVQQLGRLDIAVINAGVWPPVDEPLASMAIDRIRNTVDVNLLGAVWTARAFLGALARTGPRRDGDGASVLFIGSTAGRFGEAGHADYAMTKSALRGLVLTLKNEIVHIDPYARVNLVEPGWTVTPMAQSSLRQPGTIERVLRTTPVRQLARARDIAAAVVMLASPVSRHITGEIITVSGGMEGRVQWAEDQVDAESVLRRLS